MSVSETNYRRQAGAGVGVCMIESVTVTAGISPGAGVGVCMIVSVTVTAGIRS